MPAQRWRLILARSAEAPDLGQRELGLAWEAALVSGGLRDPIAPDPPRVVSGVPVPMGMTGDREPADLFLPHRLAITDVRARLGTHLPQGYRLVDLHDVWLGEAALPGRVVAADYLVDLGVAPGPAGHPKAMVPPDVLRIASDVVLAAITVERSRNRPDRSDRSAAGNLRPLILDIRPRTADQVWMRLRFDPAMGTGRPDDVVAALAQRAGIALMVRHLHRERVWLKGEEMADGPESADAG